MRRYVEWRLVVVEMVVIIVYITFKVTQLST